MPRRGPRRRQRVSRDDRRGRRRADPRGLVGPRVLLGLPPVPAPLAPAREVVLPAVRPPQEKWCAALRARRRHRPLPRNELARRVVRAPVVELPSLRPALGQLAAAALLGAGDADGERLRLLALGVSRAGDEASEPAVLVDHRTAARRAVHPRRLGLRGRGVPGIPRVLALGVSLTGQEASEPAPSLQELPLAALRAGLVRPLPLLRIVHLAAGPLEILREPVVELADRLDPPALSLFDPVQRLLHLSRELDLEDVRKRLEEEVVDRLPELGQVQRATVAADVTALLDRRQDLGVGRRPADSLLLELLDERRLRVPGRRLGEVLLRLEPPEPEALPDLERWEPRNLALDLLRRGRHALVGRFGVDGHEAGDAEP